MEVLRGFGALLRMEDDDWKKSWDEIDADIKRAILTSAKSRLWWKSFGEGVKGLGPLATAILAIIAIFQIFGERVHQWLTSGL